MRYHVATQCVLDVDSRSRRNQLHMNPTSIVVVVVVVFVVVAVASSVVIVVAVVVLHRYKYCEWGLPPNINLSQNC